ncbi:carboxypeptidase-like regulatory domain-containing protein [Mucilaginibacter terrae]|uniref:Carboxypeptidase-like regulatory domain-containing protein n=1 Tax=Mucilaginibacter terrae TaxID=1955052 RepID=A0ABU3GTP1_9SPHI|nr:carboxypeptidase-like regulatory domain-containing protein [Mucilaginibacter terrae]MDT3403148.1 hypothetical protein [Mucilaginibacter terrae]
MLKYGFILLLFCPLLSWAQYTISGKIINLYDKKPIAKASVFLSNTTVGSASGEDGSYTLSNVKPGQYDMVVSVVGYETFHKTVLISNNLNIPYIELTPKTVELNAVLVKPDPNWQQNYRLFKEEFFGRSPEAEQCKILNPEVLNLDFDKSKNELTASSNGYLEIENKALGYNIKYNLVELKRNYRSGITFYMGNTLFTDMQGKSSQQKKWRKARLNAYLGSSEHYFRSIISNTLTEAGFKTFPLLRRPNPQRKPDSLIKAKLKQFRMASLLNGTHNFQRNDSLNYWAEQNRLPKTVDYLVTKPLRVDSLVKRTDVKGIFALSYNEILYIVYIKKSDDGSLQNKPMNAPNNPATLMTIKEPYTFFDLNGIIINPTSFLYEGAWGTDRVAKLLPVDYDPAEKEHKP